MQAGKPGQGDTLLALFLAMTVLDEATELRTMILRMLFFISHFS